MLVRRPVRGSHRSAPLQEHGWRTAGGRSEDGLAKKGRPADVIDVVERPCWPPRLPLLRRLTATSPLWAVWKNADAAVLGSGDIDSVAPLVAWQSVVDEYRSWGIEHGLGTTIVCRHVPGVLVLAACELRDSAELLQLDVYSRLGFRRAALVGATQLRPLLIVDQRGFRRLRPGAEGLLLFLAHASRRGGRRPADPRGEQRFIELMHADPEGAEQLAHILGSTGQFALRGARAVFTGRWDRSAVLRLELTAALRALQDVPSLFASLRLDLGERTRCPVIFALEHGRRVPGDISVWLRQVEESDEVLRAE